MAQLKSRRTTEEGKFSGQVMLNARKLTVRYAGPSPGQCLWLERGRSTETETANRAMSASLQKYAIIRELGLEKMHVVLRWKLLGYDRERG